MQYGSSDASAGGAGDGAPPPRCAMARVARRSAEACKGPLPVRSSKPRGLVVAELKNLVRL